VIKHILINAFFRESEISILDVTLLLENIFYLPAILTLLAATC
jgi:hypothetical protein